MLNSGEPPGEVVGLPGVQTDEPPGEVLLIIGPLFHSAALNNHFTVRVALGGTLMD